MIILGCFGGTTIFGNIHVEYRYCHSIGIVHRDVKSGNPGYGKQQRKPAVGFPDSWVTKWPNYSFKTSDHFCWIQEGSNKCRWQMMVSHVDVLQMFCDLRNKRMSVGNDELGKIEGHHKGFYGFSALEMLRHGKAWRWFSPSFLVDTCRIVSIHNSDLGMSYLFTQICVPSIIPENHEIISENINIHIFYCIIILYFIIFYYIILYYIISYYIVLYHIIL